MGGHAYSIFRTAHRLLVLRPLEPSATLRTGVTGIWGGFVGDHESEIVDFWKPPTPLSYDRASAAAHFVAAPLLAAAAMALIGVVGADSTKFRWSGFALFLFLLAALSLISSIQLAFHARQYLYSLQDVKDWHSDYDLKVNRDWLRERQGQDFAQWSLWNLPAVILYDFGTVLLLLGVATTLAPKDDSPQPVWRWCAAGLALVCSVGEVTWSWWLNQHGLRSWWRELRDATQKRAKKKGRK
jgi:hypothetical protein